MRTRLNTKRILVKALALQLLISGLVAMAVPVYADTGIKPEGLPRTQASTGTIHQILSIVFGIIGAFAFLNVVLSGFKYVTSAGDPQKSSEAKNGIIYSLLGLAIAVSAEAIIAFVVNRVS